MRCGAKRLVAEIYADDWFAVGASEDWTRETLAHPVASCHEVFLYMMPANRGILNEIRFEPIVDAFSQALAIADRGKTVPVIGDWFPPTVAHAALRHQSGVHLQCVARCRDVAVD